MVDNRAQLHTLEGVAASIILLLAVTYAFNAFVVAPTTDVNPGVEANQQIAEDLLEASDSNGELREAVLNWNETEGQFENSTHGTYYYEGSPDAEYLSLGENLDDALTERGLSYSIEFRFSRDGGNETGSLTFVENGESGDSAVTASQTVILNNDDNVTSADGEIRLEETTNYPIPNDGEGVYNRVNVRITVW